MATTFPTQLEVGSIHQVKVSAKGAMEEGIGRLGERVVFIKNSKTRLGNVYNVRITKVDGASVYAEVPDRIHSLLPEVIDSRPG